MDNMSSTVAPTMEDRELLHTFARGKRLNYYLGIAALLVVVWVWRMLRQGSAKLPVPFYKASKDKWIYDAENLIRDSYHKFQDKVYQIKSTEGTTVLVPSKYVAELKILPEDVLSATEAVADALQSKYTKFTAGHNGDLLALVVRTRLTQNLVRLMPQLRRELQHVIATEFPDCEDWTPVKWQPFAVRAIGRISGRAFVGASLNRDEQWMDTSANYAVHVFTACVQLQFFPVWARPVAQYLVSDLRQIQRDVDNARRMLQPLLDQRLRDMSSTSAEEPPDDLMQWLIDSLPENEKANVQTHAELQLVVAAASIHTTTNLLCECMADLAAYPDVQEELRREAYQVLEVEGGWARKESMAKLKRLDSFMKEVQRHRGNITSFIRKVMKPISLSDGTELPAGTKVLAPQAGISHDERFFTNPDEFDAWRFYRSRQESEEASNRWQFTSLSDTNINFGAGKHACPGRFFAGNEVKMILAHFLLSYDVRLKKGEDRPMPVAMVMTKASRPDAELLFRRRTMTA